MYSVKSQPLILMSAKDKVSNGLNMGWIHSLHSQKPLILLVPFTNRSTNYLPNTSLWSKTKHVRAEFSLEILCAIRWPNQRVICFKIKTVSLHKLTQTDLQQISSWSMIAGSRSRPAGCRILTECSPHWWTGLSAVLVYRDLLSSGTGPEEPLPL